MSIVAAHALIMLDFIPDSFFSVTVPINSYTVVDRLGKAGPSIAKCAKSITPRQGDATMRYRYLVYALIAALCGLGLFLIGDIDLGLPIINAIIWPIALAIGLLVVLSRPRGRKRRSRSRRSPVIISTSTPRLQNGRPRSTSIQRPPPAVEKALVAQTSEPPKR